MDSIFEKSALRSNFFCGESKLGSMKIRCIAWHQCAASFLCWACHSLWSGNEVVLLSLDGIAGSNVIIKIQYYSKQVGCCWAFPCGRIWRRRAVHLLIAAAFFRFHLNHPNDLNEKVVSGVYAFQDIHTLLTDDRLFSLAVMLLSCTVTMQLGEFSS